MINEITVKETVFKIGLELRIKGDEEKGVIKEIQYSGHFEDWRKYDLMVLWLDTNEVVRTPTEHFFDVMEFVS